MPVAQISKSFLLARIEQGASQSALCAMTGLSKAKLKELLDTHSIKMSAAQRRRLPPVAEIVARLERGEHPRSIAAAAGVSVPAVYRALERASTSVTAIRAGDHNKRGRMGFPPGTLSLRGNPDLGGTK